MCRFGRAYGGGGAVSLLKSMHWRIVSLFQADFKAVEFGSTKDNGGLYIPLCHLEFEEYIGWDILGRSGAVQYRNGLWFVLGSPSRDVAALGYFVRDLGQSSLISGFDNILSCKLKGCIKPLIVV
ncbi:hypothetical protein L6452_15962 [Arctium lappa]|uniref:Uncharacterized protein n=1 Tax=Arctium lappa TaxID=4217 RepID=A0ACB9CQA5_ARCLA|nr:hypothetical protein L6452_15962 [Arctium lappa]